MGTELALNEGFDAELLAAMGLKASNSGGSSLNRLAIVQAPIMGEIEVNGKKIRTEVVPVGAYRLTTGDEQVVYATEVDVRVFAIRQQYTSWDSENKVMHKTVMAMDLNGDLKDTKGGFNIGRPSGYVEDFDALPKETKDIIRSVKHTTNVFGVVSLVGAMDEKGEPVEGRDAEVPFAMEIRSTQGRKNLKAVLDTITRRKALPVQYQIRLGATVSQKPDGGSIGTLTATLGPKVDTTPEDGDTLRDFFSYISNINQYVMDKWAEVQDGAISDEDKEIVGSIVNVQGED